MINSIEKSNFVIGQWVELEDGIGQVIYIRPNYCEKYSSEYFDGAKAGEYLFDILICKIFCDYNGLLRKRNRIVAQKDQYCKVIGRENMEMVDRIINDSPREFRDYLIYDDKRNIGGSLVLNFTVAENCLDTYRREVEEISSELGPFFTMKDFLKISKNRGVIDFGLCRKFVPGSGQNFCIILFCSLYKTVGKQKIYSKAWYR